MENNTCIAVVVDIDIALRINLALEILEELEGLGLPTDSSLRGRLRELIEGEKSGTHQANAIREIFNL